MEVPFDHEDSKTEIDKFITIAAAAGMRRGSLLPQHSCEYMAPYVTEAILFALYAPENAEIARILANNLLDSHKNPNDNNDVLVKELTSMVINGPCVNARRILRKETRLRPPSRVCLYCDIAALIVISEEQHE